MAESINEYNVYIGQCLNLVKQFRKEKRIDKSTYMYYIKILNEMKKINSKAKQGG